jgi:hypothetical protein
MMHSLLPIVLVTAQAACTTTSRPHPSPPTMPTMPEFAFIFRPTRPIAPSDLPGRNAAARDWALALQRDGKLHGANPLEDDGFKVTDAGVAPISREGAVASVLIVEAENLESALALAKRHPGLGFGTEIEVRPVKAVTPLPPGAASR